jgi:ABC-type glycerol-3-phosphate transport system substrate-binding protein
MMRGRSITAIAIAGTLVFAACGGSDEKTASKSSSTAPKTAKTGGT